MNADEILFQKIDDYLRGRLSLSDSASFESEIAADATLAALVHRHKRENEALELLTERDLRHRMNHWERQQPATLVPAGGRYRFGWLRWAAASLIIIAASWWIIQLITPVETPLAVQPETPVVKPKTSPVKPKTTLKPVPQTSRPERRVDPETPKDVIAEAPKPAPPAPVKKAIDYATLADEYYRERDFFPAPGSGGTPGSAGYDRAVRDFKNGKYTDLIPELGPGGKLSSNDIKTKELLAHSLLKSRRYDAAIAAFREIANSRKQPYADRADWALALTYLRQMPQRAGAFDQALRKITSDPGHLFYGRAKALQSRTADR